MSSARDLPAVLAEYAQIMATAPTADEVLERFNRYCQAMLPVDGVGMLLRDDVAGGLAVASADSELGRIVEQLEVDLLEGPCTDALTTGEQQAFPDLRLAEERFPRFVPRAMAAGVRSVHGLPLSARSETLGALNLIAAKVLALSADELAVAQMLGDVTSAYVVNARLLRASTTLSDQLQRALDSRVVLEQAKGVLSERHGIDVNAAFDRLRRHARGARTPVREIAQAVLRGELDV